MRPNKLRRVVNAACVAAVLLAGLMFGAGVSKADPTDRAVAYAVGHGQVVCDVLDEYPSVAGVVGIVRAIEDDGLTAGEAGQVIGMSVVGMCPRHEALLQRFIAAFATPTPVQGKVA